MSFRIPRNERSCSPSVYYTALETAGSSTSRRFSSCHFSSSRSVFGSGTRPQGCLGSTHDSIPGPTPALRRPDEARYLSLEDTGDGTLCHDNPSTHLTCLTFRKHFHYYWTTGEGSSVKGICHRVVPLSDRTSNILHPLLRQGPHPFGNRVYSSLSPSSITTPFSYLLSEKELIGKKEKEMTLL